MYRLPLHSQITTSLKTLNVFFFSGWTNSIHGTLTIVTLSRIPFRHLANKRSHLILTKSTGSLFNSTVLSGHSEEHEQDSHSCTKIYCLSVSHNSVILSKWTLPLLRSEWLDTSTGVGHALNLLLEKIDFSIY